MPVFFSANPSSFLPIIRKNVINLFFLLKALKRSLNPFSRKTRSKDMHLTESLIGIAGNKDYTIEQIKEERL